MDVKAGTPIDEPEELVNTLAGSFTDGQQFSTGNTLPLVGLPFAFNHWAPQTRLNAGSWWFNGNDHSFHWMRCTHQPSPWIGDYGWFLVAPQVGSITMAPEHFWEPRGAEIKPHVFDTTLAPFGIRFELAPTMHGAILRTTFPSDQTNKYVCFAEAEWQHLAGSPTRKILGISRRVTSDRIPVINFNFHIVATTEDAATVVNSNGVACFQFDSSVTVTTVRIATSLITQEYAAEALKRELPTSKSFDDIYNEAKSVWNRLLKRVDVVDAGSLSENSLKHLAVFYTGLYRALTFPRRTDEVHSDGRMVHYSPYSTNGGTFDGPAVTDNGFWDTFRTVYPMLSLLYPDLLGDIIQGWLNAFKEGGWLPSWASPGYRNCMVGTFADVVIADAIVKNVKGFNRVTAFEALYKDSFTAPPATAAGAVGKHGLTEYVLNGYISNDGGTGGDYVSRTLDFAFADWSTAQAFTKLATLPELAEKQAELVRASGELLKRSDRAVRALFSSQHGLMVPKARSGQFSGSFNAIEWGNGFTEGNSWHHSFPPFAVETLIELHGSKQNLFKKLHHLVSMPSNFRPGSYNFEIHEMKEGRAVAMGQYAHNNQPSHHLLYMFAMIGARVETEEHVRLIMDRAYGRDFYAGDEDNGEQGAWFVLSALGLYSVSPGSTDYVLGSPLFKHVKIKLPGGDLHIVALGTDEDVIHVDKVYLDGAEVVGPVVSDLSLQKGGVLQFVMKGPSYDTSSEEALTESKLLERYSVVPVVKASEAASQAVGIQDVPAAVEIEELQEQIERMKVKEEELRHQVRYYEHRLHSGGSGLVNGTLIDNTSAPLPYNDENHLMLSLFLFVIVCISAMLSIRFMRGTRRSKGFKSPTYNL